MWWLANSRLHLVFLQVFSSDEFVPDLEFGCFTAVFGPKSHGMDNMALLRMDVGNGQQGGQRKSLPVFVALSRQDVLRWVPGPSAPVEACIVPVHAETADIVDMAKSLFCFNILTCPQFNPLSQRAGTQFLETCKQLTAQNPLCFLAPWQRLLWE